MKEYVPTKRMLNLQKRLEAIAMAKKRTWVFGVTHKELEDMGFERDKFVELTDPVGLRLTASDVRRGVDRAIELGNPDPCGMKR